MVPLPSFSKGSARQVNEVRNVSNAGDEGTSLKSPIATTSATFLEMTESQSDFKAMEAASLRDPVSPPPYFEGK